MISNLFYLNEQGKRKNVEDTIFPKPDTATTNDKLFIVCDGVGGQAKGEEASRIACEAISEYIYSLGSNDIQEHQIQEAANYATTQMQEYVNQHPEAQQMSTTLTMACINSNEVLVAWCGDSRIYQIRKGKVLWQSRDHSLVQQLVDLGEITAEEALNHPKKNIITRSLNANTVSKTEVHSINNILLGDYILLCTDGILENIEEQAIMTICGPKQTQPNKAKLFLDYCEGKTQDNFSMYLLEIADLKKSPFFNKKTILQVLLLMVVLIGILIVYVNINKTKVVEPISIKTTPIENRNHKNKDDHLLLNLNKNQTIKKDTLKTKK
jgi:protein phosphatase